MSPLAVYAINYSLLARILVIVVWMKAWGLGMEWEQVQVVEHEWPCGCVHRAVVEESGSGVRRWRVVVIPEPSCRRCAAWVEQVLGLEVGVARDGGGLVE